jgi:hypothetical protein
MHPTEEQIKKEMRDLLAAMADREAQLTDTNPDDHGLTYGETLLNLVSALVED